MDLAAFGWLLSPPGQALLALAVAEHAAGVDDPLRLSARLRPHGSPEHVAAAVTQAVLRARAVPKWGEDAARLYFTPDGLEQATRRSVAEHRAARLAGADVVDLTCGDGGDLVALARAGCAVTGVDRDPLRAAVAGANLTALGLAGSVDVGEATTWPVPAAAVAVADPARRTTRGRTFDPDAYAPPWSFVESLLTRPACVKVAPGLPHGRIPDGVEAEWVSDAGEVKEAALWSAPLAEVRRRATLLRDGTSCTITDRDDPGAPVRAVGRYLLEPDGAVIRAGLVTAVAALVDGGLVDPHLAYVTTDSPQPTPYARSWRVVEQLPYREKPLRAALRARGVGPLTVKKRGVQVAPEQLRARLALHGDLPATLVLTRVPGGAVALLVERV